MENRCNTTSSKNQDTYSTTRLSTHLGGPCPLKIGGKDSRLSLLISGIDEPSNGRQNSRSVRVPFYGFNHGVPHLPLPATYHHAPEQ